MAIYDTMQYVQPDVATVATGLAASMGGAAGAVDVEVDVPLGILGGQQQHLGADGVGVVVTHLGAEPDDALLEEAVVDGVGQPQTRARPGGWPGGGGAGRGRKGCDGGHGGRGRRVSVGDTDHERTDVSELYTPAAVAPPQAAAPPPPPPMPATAPFSPTARG